MSAGKAVFIGVYLAVKRQTIEASVEGVPAVPPFYGPEEKKKKKKKKNLYASNIVFIFERCVLFMRGIVGGHNASALCLL